MFKRFIYPNFSNNIVNVSATLSHFLGTHSNHKSLKILKTELSKNYKNVVFVCFDALGVYPLEKNLEKDDFLRRNIKARLTSVFPSTTANATTTLISASSPLCHGWFAWSLFLKEADKVIDLFMDRNHYDYTQTVKDDFVRGCLNYDAYYLSIGKHVQNSQINKFAFLPMSPKSSIKELVQRPNENYEINTVFPPFVKEDLAKNNYYFENIQQQFKYLTEICNKSGKQFVYSYNPQPDSIMHDFGVSSLEAKQVIRTINSEVQKFSESNKDTLLIVTADHGQCDVDGSIKIWEDLELLECLQTPPFGDPRAMFVNIKTGKHKQFLSHMRKTYKRDICIFSSKALVKKGVFGNVSDTRQQGGLQTHRLGDYIIVMKSNKYFRFCELDSDYKALHTGLSKQEMYVPLITVGI